MDRNPKRARKKEARDERVARLQSLNKRRRLSRIAGVIAALTAIAGLMLYVTQQRNDDSEAERQAASAAATPKETPCPKVDAPTPQAAREYDSPPDPSVLKDGVDYSAVVKTSCGDIEMDLLEDSAPQNVANFVFLARDGYFDGLAWHRIERNFVIQTGDPNNQNGIPPDGPGYEVPDELAGTKRKDYVFGTVGMANPGVPDSAGSQWFIIVHSPDKREHAGLDPLYTIFARVERASYDDIEKISTQPVKGGSDPRTASEPTVPVLITSVEILEK